MPLPANPKETGPSKTADEWLSRREPADELESLAADAVKRFRSLVNQNDGVLCSIVCDTLYDAACRRGDGGRDRMPPTVGFLEDKVRILKAENVRRLVQATLRDLGPVRFFDVSVPLQSWLAMQNRRAS